MVRIPTQKLRYTVHTEDRRGNRVILPPGTVVRYIAKHNLPYGHDLGDYNENNRIACYISRAVGIILVDREDVVMDAYWYTN